MKRQPQPEDALVAVDEHGNAVDKQCLEEAGIAFDPTTQHLDLSKDEKRRTTALMMAIQAYNNLIIKEADMYIAVSRDAGKDGLPPIKPATMDAMVDAAIKFDWFIAGKFDGIQPPEKTAGGVQTEVVKED
jgi:hypothetical protein